MKQNIVLLMRGFAQGIPTKHLAEELGLDRGMFLERRDQDPPRRRANKRPGKSAMESDRLSGLGE